MNSLIFFLKISSQSELMAAKKIRRVIWVEEKVLELEKRIENLENTFKFYLEKENKSLQFWKRIVSDFKRIIGL